MHVLQQNHLEPEREACFSVYVTLQVLHHAAHALLTLSDPQVFADGPLLVVQAVHDKQPAVAGQCSAWPTAAGAYYSCLWFCSVTVATRRRKQNDFRDELLRGSSAADELSHLSAHECGQQTAAYMHSATIIPLVQAIAGTFHVLSNIVSDPDLRLMAIQPVEANATPLSGQCLHPLVKHTVVYQMLVQQLQ